MRVKIRQYIINNLEEDRTVTLDCPKCGAVNKFTITTKDGVALYNCFKASCITAGRVNLTKSAEDIFQQLKKPREGDIKTLPFITPYYWIDGIGNDDCLKYMEAKHMMQAYKAGLFRPLYDPAEQRFVFPIRNSENNVIGAIGKSLIGAVPKVLNYTRTFQQPFKCGTGKICYLVEDCASAVAATRDCNITGVALLGTSIRKDFIPHLSMYDWVGVALDPDAYNKSIYIKKLLTTYIKDVRILKLPNDIKDMSDVEYLNWSKSNVTL